MSCDSFLAGESDPVVGGQTPFADRGGQRFRGRTNPDCRIVVLHHEVSAVRAPEFLTDVARTAVGNMAILTRASHLSGVLTIASFFRYGVKKEHQGSHPLSAAVAAKEKELTLSRTTLLCEAWSGFDAICGVKSRSWLHEQKLMNIITRTVKNSNNIAENRLCLPC